MTGEIHNMSGNSTLKNIVKVSLSNLCIVISGVFVGFLIPKVLESKNMVIIKFSLYMLPVSYTHLDVYKRQDSQRPRYFWKRTYERKFLS